MKKDIFLMRQKTCMARALLNYSISFYIISTYKKAEEFNKSMLKTFFLHRSMPIDEYFKFEYGSLPYRSIKFIHIILKADNSSCNNKLF